MSTLPALLVLIGAATPLSPPSANALTTADACSIFGRIADKMHVLPPSEVTGTAASGYEFGILQSGRPKWVCSYETRTGNMQGGGAEITHVPGWVSLFGGGPECSYANFAAALDAKKYNMPLGAPSGLGSVATDPPTEDASRAFWGLLGGEDGTRLTVSAASEKLERISDALDFETFKQAIS